jgi:glyoxylase-like metal-dependent hydrolase (beta-lactamase superfamily II)
MTVTALADDLLQIRVPVPFPTATVNCYLVRTHEGAVLVDTGVYTPQARDVLEKALRAAGVEPGGLRAVVVTHGHPDHVGLAGWLQEVYGAPVVLSEVEAEVVRRVWQDNRRIRATARMLASHGMPEDLVRQAAGRAHRLTALVAPLGALRTVQDGGEVRAAGFSARVHWVPGHSDGHIVLLDRRGRMFCGDHVLPAISPHIALYPDARPNPLGDYLRSLRRTRDLPVRLALPGHGEAFTDWADRVEALVRHHEERLQTVLRALPAEGATAYATALQVFGPDLGIEDVVLAVTETLAHLEWLRAEGLVTREEDHPVRYRPMG